MAFLRSSFFTVCPSCTHSRVCVVWVCVWPCACLLHCGVCAISTSPPLWLAATFRPLSSPYPHPSLPQRKPAIQSGAEIKSLGAWPGPRPLANEVGERQPKSLPLGLYCLYRGLVIGGYGSGIKRLLPQPLRRVRHSLPPPLLSFSSPPPLISLFFSRGKEKSAHPIGFIHGFLPHPLLPLPASLRLCPLLARYRVRVCVCVQVAGSVAPHAALLSGSVAVGCVVPWLVVWYCQSGMYGVVLVVIYRRACFLWVKFFISPLSLSLRF